MPASTAAPADWSAAVPAHELAKLSGALASLEPGKFLANRYEIQQRLGGGGMGTVYKARDRELDRSVALKVIRPELAGQSDILKRFKQELIFARQVTHKNVIRIFDLGEADGIKFITMAYVEGQDLRSFVAERGKLSLEQSVGIIQQVCLALDAAHSEGVVHRDLKPQNIMVDNQERVTVMDFGIARSISTEGMTQTGALVGTPEYMSPEQVMGQNIDGRSDLFAMGLIFYELLTGKMPYKAETAQSSMFKRTRERALPPIEVDSSVPLFLSDVVSKCLEIDPRNRYQSAREIWTDLEAWKSGTSGRSRSFIPRWVRHTAISRTGIFVVSMILIMAVGTVPFWHKLFPKTRGDSGTSVPAISLAILPFRNASGDQKLDWLGSSLAEMLVTDVGQSSHLRNVPSDRVHQILQDLHLSPDTTFDPATLRRLGQFSSADLVVSGQFVKFGDQIRIDATLRDLMRDRVTPLKAEAPNENALPGAVDRLAQAIRENLSLSPDIMKELQAQTLKPSSNSLQALRDYNDGLQLTRQGKNLEAMKRFEASIKEDADFALAYSELALVDETLGYSTEAEQLSRKAVELGENLPSQEKYLIAAQHARIMKDHAKAIDYYENLAKVSPDNPDMQFALARLYEDAGTLDKARAAYGKILAADPKNVGVLLARGRVAIEGGDPQGGLDFLNRALSLSIQLGNEEEKSMVLQAIGVAYSELNKPDDAVQNYRQSLEIKHRLGNKRGIADSLDSIAQIESTQGKLDLALKDYNEAMKLRREIGDKQGLGDVLINLSEFYTGRGKYDQALALLKESLQIQREVGNENNQALALNNIGNAYLSKGDYDDARIYFEQSLAIREKFKVPGDIADTLHNLAEVSSNLGQYDQALAQYLRALDLRRGAGDKRGAAIESYSMGTVFGYQGRFGAAVNSKEEALKTFRELNERGVWLSEILSSYGGALAEIGRSDDAQKALDEALTLASDIKNQALIVQTQGYRGDVFFYRGDYNSARPLYEQAYQGARRAADRRLMVVSEMNLAKLAVKQSHPQSSINTLRGLAEQANTIGLKYLSAACLTYLAEALIDIRKYQEAQEELQRALSKSEKLGSRAFLVQNHWLLGRVAELRGNTTEARRQQKEALQILGSIREEAHSDLKGRADLVAISLAPVQK